MNLFIARIYNEKLAGTIAIVIGLFIIAGGAVFLLSARNNGKFGFRAPSAGNHAVIDSVKINDNLDSDSDGLPDNLEKILGTDPKNSDTDNDGYKDEEEIKNSYSPLVAAPSEKYSLSEFEKIKTDIKNFSPEVYDNIFSEKENDVAIASISPTPAISPIFSPVVSSSPTPAPSPTASPSPAVLKEKDINKDWAYILYVPPGFDKTEIHPLVLVFYGTGGVISDSINNWRAEADKSGFVIAALLPYEKKYPSGSVVESYPWAEASDFASSALKDIKKEYKIDEKNIFLEGYSTGAATAYIVALENQIKFKGVIPIGGYLPLEAGIVDKLINSSGVNFYVIHGANDANLKAVIAQEKTLLQYGAKMKFVTLPDFATSEYPTDEQKNIAGWMKGLM